MKSLIFKGSALSGEKDWKRFSLGLEEQPKTIINAITDQKLDFWKVSFAIGQRTFQRSRELLQKYCLSYFLIFIFLGVLTIIKKTFLRSKSASDFTVGEWNVICKSVNKHKSWEEGVTIVLLQSAKAITKPVFRLNEDLRAQVLYWRPLHGSTMGFY